MDSTFNPDSPEARHLFLLVIYGQLLLNCFLAYLFARWLTGLSRNWALRLGIVSQVTQRSSHSVPTARLGGVGLVLGFGIASALYLILPFSGPFEGTRFYWLCAGWLFIFIVGLLDDVYDLHPLLKLSLSIVAVLIPTMGGQVVFHIFDDMLLPSFMMWSLNIGLSCFWLLFFINAFNFMDGMDGFAAGFARLSAFFLFIIFCIIIETKYASIGYEFILLPMLATACWGFLHWNNPPARVFMGDAGSLAVGYLLAVYVLLGSEDIDFRQDIYINKKNILFIISALTILLPFIFDVVLTLVWRTLRGENIIKAHRQHLYQRLLKTGLSHAEVLKINTRRFWIINLAALAGALPAHPAGRWAAFAFALAVMIHYWRMVLARERAAAANQ